MGFKYRSQLITLDNYREVFKACSVDVLDEIRSAVLDDTPISQFIKPCGFDSYLLGQLRMGAREMIPQEYLNARLTGRTVYNIRQGFVNGRDMSGLLRYIGVKTLKLDKDTIEKLSDFCLMGADISKVDFTKVPSNLVTVFGKGLYRGYPMWLLVDEDAHLTEDMVQVLMRGMALGVDIHPFIGGEWSKAVLLLLFSYNKTVDLNNVLRFVNHRFDTDQIKVLLDLETAGIPITELCVKDSTGAPVYNSYQMYEIGEAIKAGVVSTAMYNPSLSDFDIAQMREAALKKKAGS